ncbi:MAG: glutamine amidotransferase-related protein, partial [Pseudoclavibacter sp.]
MILVLDNRDSYTFNLVQCLRGLTTREVHVVSADDGDEALRCFAEGEVSGVVISPGPGHPDLPGDFEASGALIDAVLAAAETGAPAVPMLGVCLGHQGLARRFGYEVVPAPEPRHGWLSPLEHDGTGLFEGVDAGTRVTRYHSLAIEPGERPSPRLRVTARSEDRVVQAFAIEGAPWFGVQFHPESIASDEGPRVLANFVADVERADVGHRLVDGLGARFSGVAAPERAEGFEPTALPEPIEGDPIGDRVLHLRTRAIELDAIDITPRGAAAAVMRGVIRRGIGSFWLDSAFADGDEARWSVLGDATDVTGEGTASVVGFRLDEVAESGAGASLAPGTVAGTMTRDSWSRATGARSTETSPCDDPFAWLEAEFAGVEVEGGEGLPLRGGRVGYIGYELGLRDLGVDAPRAATPDACWIRPSRYVVIDHVDRMLTVCVVGADVATVSAALERE